MQLVAVPLFIMTLATFQDAAREASMRRHSEELAAFATSEDLSAAFTARDNRVKATLEAMDAEMLANGEIPGIVKKGSRYSVQGGTRPDLLHIETMIMFFLGDTRQQEIENDLLQRGFQVADLPVWKAFADKEARKRYTSETSNDYFLSRNTNPKLTREFIESKGDEEYYRQHPELLDWTDEEYLAYHNLSGEARAVAQAGWATAFMEQLAPSSRRVVLAYIEERFMPTNIMSFGYEPITPEELALIQEGIRKVRKEWGLEP